MKKSFILFITLLLFATLVNANNDNIQHPKLKFETDGYDYGVMYLDSMPDTQFEIRFTNIGNEPLIINRVRACCGTRVLEWPQEPIMKGEEGLIKISYNLAQRVQRFTRTITVTTNNPNSANEIFRIRGEISER